MRMPVQSITILKIEEQIHEENFGPLLFHKAQDEVGLFSPVIACVQGLVACDKVEGQ